MSSRSLKADGFLLLITIAWGMTFPLLEDAVHYVSPAVFVVIRFFFGGLILLPFLWRQILKSDKRTLYFGLFIAALNAVVYVTQTQGMETVSAAQGAFITALNVIFVPLFLPFFGLGKPRLKDLLCAAICLGGVFYLTDAGFHSLKAGIWWISLAAIFVALSIVAIQKASQDSKHINALAFYQIFLTSFIVFPFSTQDHYAPILHLTPLLAVGFCAIFATALALLIQTRYQRETTASRAALIFALEPVFATFFGYFINGEAITSRVIVGGGLILASILISEVFSKK